LWIRERVNKGVKGKSGIRSEVGNVCRCPNMDSLGKRYGAFGH
jgi:hypothetical protein